MINSRKIEDLQPYPRYLCKRLIEECMKQGIEILITSTLRDDQYQETLYQQGRTKPGSIVTSLKQVGAHGFGLAFDFVPLVNGNAAWGRADLFEKVGRIGQSLGLEWGGSWKKFIDRPHMQYVQGLTTRQLRAGKRPKFPPIPSANKNVEGEEDMLSKYKLNPICYGQLNDKTETLDCKEEPSNKAQTNATLKKYVHKKFPIYAKVENEGGQWYLVNINPKLPQWVAAHYVELI